MGPRRNSAKAFAAFNYTNLDAFDQRPTPTERNSFHPVMDFDAGRSPFSRHTSAPSIRTMVQSPGANLSQQSSVRMSSSHTMPLPVFNRRPPFPGSDGVRRRMPLEGVTTGSSFSVSQQKSAAQSSCTTENFLRREYALTNKRKSNSVDIPLHNMNLKAELTSNLSSNSLQLETSRRKNSLHVPTNFEVEAWYQEFYGTETPANAETDPFDELLDCKIFEAELATRSDSQFQTVNSQPMKKCNSPSQQHDQLSPKNTPVNPAFTRKSPLHSTESSSVVLSENDAATDGEKSQKTRSLSLRQHRKSSKPRQRRLKWSVTELYQLWSGIREHGNEWREIENSVENRTYHQIKDKGRRLLQTERWVTGKTKKDTENAKQVAKDIAQEVLRRYQTTGKLSRDDDDEACSDGSTIDSDVRQSLVLPEMP